MPRCEVCGKNYEYDDGVIAICPDCDSLMCIDCYYDHPCDYIQYDEDEEAKDYIEDDIGW